MFVQGVFGLLKNRNADNADYILRFKVYFLFFFTKRSHCTSDFENYERFLNQILIELNIIKKMIFHRNYKH